MTSITTAPINACYSLRKYALNTILTMVALTVVGGCRCTSSIKPAEKGFRVEPTEIDFGRVQEGEKGQAHLDVINTGAATVTVLLSTERPFGVDFSVEVSGGGRVSVPVTFLAENGPAQGTLIAKGLESEYLVTLKGTGVRPLQCKPSNPCRTSRYELATHSCVETEIPEGAACTPDSTCLEKAQCRGGLCQGVARNCDDHNKCTVDGCAEGIGCVNTAKACPVPQQPCQIATCDPQNGCGQTQAPDLSPCGVIDCEQAHLCFAGACLKVPTPDGTPCSPKTPCQAMGTCQNKVCERPDAGILEPEITLSVGGLPPISRPMLVSFGGQLFGEICGRPLPPIARDAGDDGGTDAGFDDAGTGCELFSYTNNGFERFIHGFGDNRERILLHLSELGAALLDDGGFEIRSLKDGMLLQRHLLAGTVEPKGVAYSAPGEPWFLMHDDAGSSLMRVVDAGVERMQSLDASVSWLALEDTSTVFMGGAERLGYSKFDDAGSLEAPRWVVNGPVASETLSAGSGIGFFGNTHFVATANDGGLLASLSWLDDAGQPLRVESRFGLLGQGRAVVFFKLCPAPLSSCLAEDEQLRMRVFDAKSGEVLHEIPIAPMRTAAQVVEASMLEVPGFPPGVAALVRTDFDAGSESYLELTVGSRALMCSLPPRSEVVAAAFGGGFLWAYLKRGNGPYVLEAYRIEELPIAQRDWPMADGLYGQRRAR